MAQEKRVIVEADDPRSADLITVAIIGAPSLDRQRVMRVLAHLFGGDGGEWDGPAPNVRLLIEHSADPAEA